MKKDQVFALRVPARVSSQCYSTIVLSPGRQSLLIMGEGKRSSTAPLKARVSSGIGQVHSCREQNNHSSKLPRRLWCPEER